MENLFYAVQHGDDYSSDNGSENKQEALAIAADFHEWFPDEEIRISVCKTDDDYCLKEIIVYEAE